MGTYPLETVINEWKKGNLTTEQAVGQVLLLIQEMQKRLSEIEVRLFRYEKHKS